MQAERHEYQAMCGVLMELTWTPVVPWLGDVIGPLQGES